MSRLASAVRRATRFIGRGLLALGPWAALGAAIAVFVVQPDRADVDPGLVVAIASLAGVALSLGFAVTLLIAQHTAERHVRLMFAEFRADRTWVSTLAWFATGVGLIVTAGIARPTTSTAWAALLTLVWLALLGARAFPRLLDSLDPVVLAERAAQRAVRRLERARPHSLGRLDEQLVTETGRGITACATMAHEALVNDDGDVLEAALAGMRSILISYLRRSPLAQPTDLPVDLVFQRIDVITENVSRRSQVILMPVFIAELKQLGIEAVELARLNPYGSDPVSLRLNMVLVELIAASLRNRSSTAPSFAATTIADLGVALVEANRPNAVSDHVRRLTQISLAGLDADADHVSAAANHGLARVAAALLLADRNEVMPPSIFGSACEGIASSMTRHIERKDQTLQGQTSMFPLMAPLAQPSLATLAVGGASIAASAQGFSPEGFGYGADNLATALAALSASGAESPVIRGNAVECLYSALVGLLAVARADPESAHRVDRWSSLLSSVVLADEQKGEHKLFNAPETLASALLLGVYALPTTAPVVAEKLRAWVVRVADAASATPPGFERRRVAGAFVPSAVAAVARREGDLVESLIHRLGADLRERLEAGFHRQFTPQGPMLGIPKPPYGTDHQEDEAIAGLLGRIDAA